MNHMNKKTDWELLKETADKDELKEYHAIELRNLKNRQMFYASTPPEKRSDMMRNNVEVRKKARAILKNEDALNKFMYAKDFDSYEKQINPKHFEKIADNLKKPMNHTSSKVQSVNPERSQEENILDYLNKERRGLDTIVYFNEADKKKGDQIKKEAVEFGDPETWNKHVDQYLEDTYKGIGSMETPNPITVDAVKNLKDPLDD